jgi:hypothetical protein
LDSMNEAMASATPTLADMFRAPPTHSSNRAGSRVDGPTRRVINGRADLPARAGAHILSIPRTKGHSTAPHMATASLPRRHGDLAPGLCRSSSW